MKTTRDSYNILRSGGVLNLDGILLVMDDGELAPGDLYVAERNTGPKLLTVHRINHESMVVFPTTNDYSFDLWECTKVKEFEGDEAKS